MIEIDAKKNPRVPIGSKTFTTTKEGNNRDNKP